MPFRFLPSFFPSIRIFSNKSALHIKRQTYQSFSFNIHLSKVYSGLISFRIDCFDLLAIQRTLKSFHWHHNTRASDLQHSAFFMAQLSHPYLTTGKNHSFDYIDLCWQSDVFAVNMLFRFAMTFLTRSKCFLTSWLWSPSVVILEPKNIKFVTASTSSPSICHEVMGPDAMILSF